jgi:hypothetical protein
MIRGILCFFLAVGGSLFTGAAERELGLGEAVPEEPRQPLRRYLYLAMRDSSILAPGDAQAEDAVVTAWAESILARAKQTCSRQCMEALVNWLDRKHHSRSWVPALRARIGGLSTREAS